MSEYKEQYLYNDLLKDYICLKLELAGMNNDAIHIFSESRKAIQWEDLSISFQGLLKDIGAI